jgi:hypothetical protein
LGKRFEGMRAGESRMLATVFGVFAVAAGGVAFLSCGGSGGGGGNGVCEDPPSLAGSWFGIVEDSECGGGALRVTLVQDECSLTGRWSINSPSCNVSGSLEGEVDGSSFRSDFSSSDATLDCVARVTGIVSGGSEITGTYAAIGSACELGGGTFEIDRQPGVTPTATIPLQATPVPTPSP